MLLGRIGTSTARSGEKMRQPLRGPRLFRIIDLIHKEDRSRSTTTSMKSFSMLTATTSSRLQAPI